MRYHLFLNLFTKMVKIAKAFSRKHAVPRYMATSVCQIEKHSSQHCKSNYYFPWIKMKKNLRVFWNWGLFVTSKMIKTFWNCFRIWRITLSIIKGVKHLPLFQSAWSDFQNLFSSWTYRIFQNRWVQLRPLHPSLRRPS